jgi:hypothetical protein
MAKKKKKGGPSLPHVNTPVGHTPRRRKRYGPARSRAVYVHPFRGGGTLKLPPEPRWYVIDAGQTIWTRRYLSGGRWVPCDAEKQYAFGCRMWSGGGFSGFLWGSTEIRAAHERIRVTGTPPEGWPT